MCSFRPRPASALETALRMLVTRVWAPSARCGWGVPVPGPSQWTVKECMYVHTYTCASTYTCSPLLLFVEKTEFIPVPSHCVAVTLFSTTEQSASHCPSYLRSHGQSPISDQSPTSATTLSPLHRCPPHPLRCQRLMWMPRISLLGHLSLGTSSPPSLRRL